MVAVLLHQLDLQFATVGQRQTKLQRTRNSIDLMLWVFDMLQDEKGADAEFGCPLPNGIVEIVQYANAVVLLLECGCCSAFKTATC